MKRTCKLAAAALLTAAVTVGTVTACAAAETAVTTETYYLQEMQRQVQVQDSHLRG